MSDFDVLVCSTCTQTWIHETGWRAQGSVSCPHCGKERAPKKVRCEKTLGSRDAAAEWRSRYHAKEADEATLYNDFVLENGQYGRQEVDLLERAEAVVDRFDVDLEVSDFARFEELVDVSMDEERERYADLVDEWCADPGDELADLVSLEDPDHELFENGIRDDLEAWASPPDRDDIARGEVTPTDQPPVSAAAILELDADATVTAVWESLFEHARVRTLLAESVKEFFAGADVTGVYDALEDLGIPYWIRSEIVNAARGDANAVGQLEGELVPSIPDSPMASTDDLLAAAQLLGAAEDATLSVIVEESWLESRRRDQRVDVCHLLAVLADSFDVRVVASGFTLSKVVNSHRVDLPGVSEWCSRQRASGASDETAKAIAGDLEADSFEVAMLRELYADSSGILSYAELYDLYPGDNDSRVRQLVSEFVDDDLVTRFGPQCSKKVELRPLGEQVLETFERETARQRSISDFASRPVNGSGKQDRQGRVTTETGLGGGEDGEDNTAYYRTRYLGPAAHAAVAASGGNGGVMLVRGGIEDHEQKTRYVSYDDERRVAVVAVRAGEPLPLTVSSALALASEEFVDRVLTPTRLESVDDPAPIVRDARCIGAASDEALEDGQTFRDNLIGWGEELSRLTTQLKRGECDDRDSFRSAIVRSAHGLWGTIAHILEALDITLHREIRVPEGLKLEKREAFADSLAHAAAIQSLYGAHACYRQLFEDRTEKREAAMTPSVDAADPTGSLIGSFVLRGPDVHKLEDPLRDRLESPKEVHEDAPEFGVEIPVRSEPDRVAYANTLQRILSRKNLRPTGEAVATTHALIETPQDAARVLHRYLSPEADRREIRPDELRTAFANLEACALVPDLGTDERRTDSAGKIVKVLLEADEPLSKTELAERADVSPKTVYNYREDLESLGLLLVTGDGYRLALSFSTSEERADPVLPSFADGSFLDAVDALLLESLPPDRYGDPSDPIGGVLFWPQDPWALLNHDEYGPWVWLAAKLTGETPPDEDDSDLLMGPVNKQQPIKTAVRQAAAD
ncbi:helix-turn-helix domain-containing protein [Natronosalvus rutilus]|uniref:Helix-turn-helix domain-containing protein n=1 Tax=Natronosalvus rutilus TaxID=2953753 RepID=A0A9E7N9E2_9EURY|nr:helix-turn-helix domain-containing protein [Natronosalvus rutilus]UTF52788.1 helix-turn-helix domain-containing protein [Natronosalvus rutilus]